MTTTYLPLTAELAKNSSFLLKVSVNKRGEFKEKTRRQKQHLHQEKNYVCKKNCCNFG